MHTFQDMPVEMIEVDPFTTFQNDWALLMAEKDGKANGMTISWGAMGVLWNKNVVTVFVRDDRYTKEFMEGSDYFSVSFFHGKEKNALKYFGAVSGRTEDKFAASGFHVNHHKDIGFVDESHFAIVCKKIAATRIEKEDMIDPSIAPNFYSEGAMHTMYVGEVVEFLAR